MTEEDAKTKWCPFARTAQPAANGPYSANRKADGSFGASSCIASACMAWRDTTPADSVRIGRFREGFCGLARAPQ